MKNRQYRLGAKSAFAAVEQPRPSHVARAVIGMLASATLWLVDEAEGIAFDNRQREASPLLRRKALSHIFTFVI